MKLRRETWAGKISVIALPPCDRTLGSILRIPDRFLHGELPVQVARVDDHIEDMGVLLDVADAAAGAGVLNDLLQRAAADRAVGGEAERAAVGRDGVARLRRGFPP